MLFRIDPTPFDAQVKAIKAQLKLSDTRLSQMTQLFERDAGRGFDVEQRQSEVDQLKAQLEGAKWNLDKTVVRAPGRRLRDQRGACAKARASRTCRSRPSWRSSTRPIRSSASKLHRTTRAMCGLGRMPKSRSRSCLAGSTPAKVESILQSVATGQVQTSGLAVAPKAIQSLPFVVRIKLDDAEFARALPAGATGDAAIFTDHVKAAHVIRKVLLRQIAITNYVNPF